MNHVCIALQLVSTIIQIFISDSVMVTHNFLFQISDGFGYKIFSVKSNYLSTVLSTLSYLKFFNSV